MSTPRELYVQSLKSEIDRFAARMKALVDHYESEARVHQLMTAQLAEELDRLEFERPDQRVSQ